MIRLAIPHIILLSIGAILCTSLVFMHDTVRREIKEARLDAVVDFIEQQPIEAIVEMKIDNLPKGSGV